MKTANVGSFWFLTTIMVFFSCHSIAHADPSGGGTTAISIAAIIHKAAGVESLSRELDQALAAYGVEQDETSRNEMWKKAQDILAKLIEQANNVESEISIMSKKRLETVYARKLDRVLSNVMQMKTTSEEKMRSAETVRIK